MVLRPADDAAKPKRTTGMCLPRRTGLASRAGPEDGVEANGDRLRQSQVREFLQDDAGAGSEQGLLAMREARFGMTRRTA